MSENLNNLIPYMKQIMAENTDIITKVHELYKTASPEKIRGLIEKHFIPSEKEKKENAEIPTPVKLVDEMLDKIPKSFWTKPQKVLEPCCGKGNFVLGIFDRFYNGMKRKYKGKEAELCKIIITECLYFIDIEDLNVFITKSLLICHCKMYAKDIIIDDTKDFNCIVENTLEVDIDEKWGIQGFDAIIGNPPYNSSGNTGTGNTIWQYFTKLSLDKWLLPDGYLVYVHPPGWRKPNTERGKFYRMYELMTIENQMIYLSIHGIKDGQQTFNCGTRYDWYLIQKKSKYTTTIVNDEKGKNVVIDMNEFNWLPNYNIETIKNILAKEGDEKCPIIYNRSNYGSDKKYTQKDKTNEFKYPIIHTIPKTGIRYIYSNCNDKGHFGISKVIFGQSNCENPYIDMTGKYGMSEHSMAIKVSSSKESKNIEKCLKSEKFNNKVLNSCLWSNFMIDWRLFTYFKKDFWKEFI